MILKLKKLIYRLLRSGEKYTHSDNIYIARQGSYLGLSSFVFSLTALISALVFARYLPKETYGQYKYILSVIAIFYTASLGGLDAALLRAVAKGFDRTVHLVFRTKLKWNLLASLGALLVGFYFLSQDNQLFFWAFLTAAFLIPLQESPKIYQAYLDGKKKFNKRALYTSLTRIIQASFLIAVVVLTKNLLLLIVVYFITDTLLANFFFIRTLHQYPPKSKQDKKSISYGKHLTLMNIIKGLSDGLDEILIFAFLGPVQVAIYAFAVLPIAHLRKPLKILVEIAAPKLVQRKEEDLKKQLPAKIIKALFLIVIPLIIFYILIAPWAFRLLFPQYLESIPFSQLAALHLLSFPAVMLVQALRAHKKTKGLYRIYIFGPLLRIALLCLMVPFYGVAGAILSRFFTILFSIALSFYYFKKT